MHETRIVVFEPTIAAQPIPVTAPAEVTLCPGLVITPHIEWADGRGWLAGGWCVTHEPTGLRVTDRVFEPLADARAFALLLAASGINFTVTDLADEYDLARTTVRACLAELASTGTRQACHAVLG